MRRIIRVRDGIRGVISGIDKASWYLFVLGAVTLCAMMLLITYGATSRYVFNKPVAFKEELVGALLLVASVAAFAHILKEGKHVRISMLMDRLSPRGQAILELVSHTLALLFLVIFTILSWRWTIDTYSRHITYSNLTVMPQFPYYGIMFVGSTFLVLELIILMAGVIKKLFR